MVRHRLLLLHVTSRNETILVRLFRISRQTIVRFRKDANASETVLVIIVVSLYSAARCINTIYGARARARTHARTHAEEGKQNNNNRIRPCGCTRPVNRTRRARTSAERRTYTNVCVYIYLYARRAIIACARAGGFFPRHARPPPALGDLLCACDQRWRRMLVIDGKQRARAHTRSWRRTR